MPFLGRRDDRDDLVVPEEVADGETVHCPACSGRMRPRGGGKCSGLGDSAGESDRHRKWKSLAVSGLRARFEDFDIAHCGLECDLDVSKGPSLLTDRRADAIIQFADPITRRNLFFGAGVIVEVQHRNDSKDVAAVTADYLKAGYSVY